MSRLYRGNGTTRTDILFDHFYDGHLFEVPFTCTGLTLADPVTLRVLSLNTTQCPIFFEAPPPLGADGAAIGLSSVFSVVLTVTD